MMSSTIASGSKSRAACSAWNPEPAVRTSQPSMRSAIDSRSVSICSSSTTRTRRAEPSRRRSEGADAVVVMTPIVRAFLCDSYGASYAMAVSLLECIPLHRFLSRAAHRQRS